MNKTVNYEGFIFNKSMNNLPGNFSKKGTSVITDGNNSAMGTSVYLSTNYKNPSIENFKTSKNV
jgi:hypothetical protein